MKSKTNPTSKNISDLEQVKLDLLSLISHELRTPLTSVIGALTMLKQENLSALESQKLIDLAWRNAERLHMTLAELLDLSRLGSGRFVCQFHEVALKPLVTTHVERAKKDAVFSNRELSVQIDDSVFEQVPALLADAPRLEHLLDAVFDNAFKFSPPASRVEFMMQAVQRSIEFRWANELKEQVSLETSELFRSFSQQENILNRRHEGLGGSLAIVGEVVRQHAGEASAEVRGEHFVLTIRLPVLEYEQALLKVLESRMYGQKNQVGALALVVLKTSAQEQSNCEQRVKASLFRASDAVYRLSAQGELAIVMDDCKKKDAPKILKRLLDSLSLKTRPSAGIACFPDDALEPKKLIELARAAETKA